MICKNCQTENPQGFSFCGVCGQSLVSATPVGLLDDEELFSAERRFLTVMFCDLVGSTELSAHLDPELIHELIQQYHSVTATIIQRRGGAIAQYLGDGLLVYFGYPKAVGNDAERAIQTALEIVGEFKDIVPVVQLPPQLQLRVRVGIHSGSVVTAELGQGRNRDRLALGSTPNVAARLEGLAQPNGIAVSEATRAITARHFEFRDLGEHELKGWNQPVRVYEPVNELPPLLALESDKRMYGRHKELQFLLARLREVEHAGAQSVKIIGPSGIGKTRLVRALQETAGADVRQAQLQCDADDRQTALMPFQRFLRAELGFRAGDEAEAVVEKLSARLSQRDAFALAALLRVSPRDGGAWLQGRPEDQKQLIFEALVNWFRGYSGGHTLLFILEDVKYSDASTREFMREAKRMMAEDPVFFVETERFDGESSENIDREGLDAVVTLSGLADAEGAELIRSVADPPDEELERILKLAQGVPLFMEELAHANRAGFSGDVSEGLQYLFAPRLDRLGSSKRTAIVASVIGRVFDAQLLGEVVGIAPAQLQEDLQNLVDEDVVCVRQEPGHYEFAHTLLQEALNENVLQRSLRSLHERVADVLETQHPDEVHMHPERIARHWRGARKADQALPYYLKAANMARSVFANAEAIALAQDAIAMAADDHELAPEGQQQVLDLRECLGDVHALIRQSDSAKAQFEEVLVQSSGDDIVRRARAHRKIGTIERYETDAGGLPSMHAALDVLGDDAAALGDAWRQEWAQVQFELAITHYSRGNVNEMASISAELEPFINEHATDAQQAEFANQMLLVECMRNRFRATERTMFYVGEFVRAAERANDLPTLAAACHSHGMMHLHDSQLREAERYFDRCLAVCEQCGYKATEVRAFMYYAVLRRRQNDVEGAKNYLHKGAQLAHVSGMAMYEHLNTAMLAWFAYRDGQYDQAVQLGRSALQGWSDLGARYAFRWIASLPLLAAAAVVKDGAAIRLCLADLKDDSQQYLDERLMQLIECCDAEPTAEQVDAVIACARMLAYI